MHIEGEILPGGWSHNFLERRSRAIPCTRQQVVVNGCSNTAIDCARTALRKGDKSVQAHLRRTRRRSPPSFEVEEACMKASDPLPS
jgi:formate dehydrogenase major subunit